jgi:hypothetical protein
MPATVMHCPRTCWCHVDPAPVDMLHDVLLNPNSFLLYLACCAGGAGRWEADKAGSPVLSPQLRNTLVQKGGHLMG